MEGWQKILNDIMSRSNAFMSAGKVPDDILRKGSDAVEDYLIKQLSDVAKTKEQWVFDEAQMKYMCNHAHTFDRQEELVQAQRTMDWATKVCSCAIASLLPSK